MDAEIGIIGGTGVYDPELLKEAKEVEMETHFGKPSDKITVGIYEGRRVAILPRHGKKHTIPPHLVNSRANIDALRQLGVKRIIASTATGSLQEDIHPGDMILIDQFIDRTHGRKSSFYDGTGKVCHISVADPVCPELHRLFAECAKKLGLNFRDSGTYVCINGPRFSTRAESRLYKSWGAHVIGMTLVPEIVLAREAEICYLSIASVTDYDTFREEPVSIEKIIEIMKQNLEKVKNLIADVVPKIPEERECPCREALHDAFV